MARRELPAALNKTGLIPDNIQPHGRISDSLRIAGETAPAQLANVV